MTLLDTLLEQAASWGQLEIVAVVAAIFYLVLAIRQNIWCWLFAAISTAVYVWVFFTARLYMESVLNVFYLVMAAYGFWVWRYGAGPGRTFAVQQWALRRHLPGIGAILVLSAITGWLLSQTDAAFPYVDSLTTWSAIWATYLQARKVLENWWYFLLIDIASVFIYWSRDLQLTSLLFVVYVAMIPFGLLAWRRSFRAVNS